MEMMDMVDFEKKERALNAANDSISQGRFQKSKEDGDFDIGRPFQIWARGYEAGYIRANNDKMLSKKNEIDQLALLLAAQNNAFRHLISEINRGVEDGLLPASWRQTAVTLGDVVEASEKKAQGARHG